MTARIQRRTILTAGAALALAGCGRPATQVAGGFVATHPERGHLLRGERPSGVPIVQPRTQVLIAGGGVAALSAARTLRQRGIEDFALLELEDEAGGNSRGSSIHGIACPLGAHYLPVPGDDAREVQDLLEEFGLRRREAGRWIYDERHLCHSPQERLFFNGEWQDGLLPVAGVGAATLAQYRRFAQDVERLRREAHFAIPLAAAALAPALRALDAQTFAGWLDARGLTDPHLRWYLGYCCRDDYGAGLDTVSAWAGIHYFASRHGFHAPGGAQEAEREAVLTWPEGNAWLARRLAAPLGERVRTRRVVLRIAAQRHGVEVDAWNVQTRTLERWQAAHCIVALPLFVAVRVVQNPPSALTAAAAALRYAPWIVSNLHIRAPLHDRPGPAPSWDNVVYGTRGLGYVDAQHQSLRPLPGPTVLTHYHAPLAAAPSLAHARRDALEQPWTHWRDTVLAELSVPHPDLPEKLTRMEVVRYGHAMSIPIPGLFGHPALQALQSRQPPVWQRLHFAHGDLSGYSIFEEAFAQGHRAALTIRT